jgi:K(+)-stimulated pyrophosphate-energized sodium pump
VTVLGIILGIEVAGLAFALLAARAVARRESDSVALRRLASALDRAARSFLFRQARLVGVVSLVLLAALVAPFWFGDEKSALSPLGGWFWGSVALVAGASAALVVAGVSAAVGVRGAVASLTTARASLNGALTSTLRAGTASGLFAESLSLLVPLCLFGLAFAVKGGFTLPSDQARALASELSLLLPPFALGAAAAALILARSGGAYHASGDVGGDLAGETDAGLEHDDPRNPAMVSDFVGDQLGNAARATDGFATATAIGVGSALLALRTNGELVLLGLLPLLVRAFGVVACVTGFLVVRTEEAKDPVFALLRGHLSALVVLLAGLGAAAHSLFGVSFWFVFGAGLLGPLGAGAAAYAGLLGLMRRRGSLKQALETLRVGGGVTVAAGLGAGLESALLPVAIVALSGGGAYLLGEHAGVAAGGEAGLLLWLGSLAALFPFALAVGAFASVADSARGMSVAVPSDPEVVRRAARLDDAGFVVGALSNAYAVVLGTLAALGMGVVLSLLARRPEGAGVASLGTPALIASAAIGAALVLTYAGSAARGAARGAREVALEVERQLRGFPREQGLAVVPSDYTPSYKSCEELTARSALRGVLPAATYLLVPLLLGTALRFMYRTSSPWLTADGLAAFVVAASVTGLGAALVVAGARALLGSVRRATRPRGATPGFVASVTGDAVADILGHVAGPAAHSMGKAGAALLLALSPFLL